MYGDVRDVSFQCWTYMPDVGTSTRLVSMVIQKQIPRIITIGGIRCKVLYRGQPLTWDICSKNGHKASACPDKGKCLRYIILVILRVNVLPLGLVLLLVLILLLASMVMLLLMVAALAVLMLSLLWLLTPLWWSPLEICLVVSSMRVT